MNRNVTIIGAGSSGMSTAAWLQSQGWKVTLCDTADQTPDFDVIRKQKGIILRGNTGNNGCIMPERLTNDFAQALEDTERVIVCTSAGRHEELAKSLAPLARAGQAFLFSPGNFGSFFLRRELKKSGKQGVLAAELSGNLWACRSHAPGEVLVARPLGRTMKTAALPACDTQKVIDIFNGVLPLAAGRHVLEVSLNSPNVVSHVAGAVLNAVEIERRGKDFQFFVHGMGESTLKCFAALEKERNAVMGKLGMEVYSPSCEGFMRMLMDRDSHPELNYFRNLDGPSDFSHRYVSEDAACGMAMLVSLGQRYGVPTRFSQALLAIAGVLNGEDYVETGRTLENLGIGDLSADQLNEMLLEGRFA